MDAIGWATCFRDVRREIVDLLLERGARHHVFSAIAVGDTAVVRAVLAADAAAIHRRLSIHEQEQTALHYVIAPADGLVGGTFRTGGHYATLRLLIDSGAELEARDAKGRTPMEVAMLRGDTEAMRLLDAAGAARPDPRRTGSAEEESGEPGASGARSQNVAGVGGAPAADVGGAEPDHRGHERDLEASVAGLRPMMAVADVRATIAWYESIGFRCLATHGEDGSIDWAALAFGDAEIMLVPSGRGRPQVGAGLSLWIRIGRIDELYERLKRRRLERAAADLDAAKAPNGETANRSPVADFAADLHTAFYGQREFAVRDPNGVDICFFQPVE